MTSPDNIPELGHVSDPALSRPEVATAGFGQPAGVDPFSASPVESPSDMPTPAARAASRWAVVWMAALLIVLLVAVVLIIVK